MNGHGDGLSALANMAIICRSLLENDGMAEPTKAEARELLKEWMHLARQGSMVPGEDHAGDDEEALWRRMESFVREQAAHGSVARR